MNDLDEQDEPDGNVAEPDGNVAEPDGNVAAPDRPFGSPALLLRPEDDARRLNGHGTPAPSADPVSLPFAHLTPDRLLDALEAAGFRGDGRLVALNSYENRVYLVYLEEPLDPPPGGGALADSVVVKFYRSGRWTDAQIAEEHAFVAALLAHEVPAVAPLADAAGVTLHHFNDLRADLRFAVYPRRGGRAPELDRRETLNWIGRFMGRIHSVGATGRFQARLPLDIDSHGEVPRRWLRDSGLIPTPLLPAWESVVERALDGVRNAYKRCGDYRRLRLHGDCHAGNILWTDAGPHFVDFDDACTGPAVQDLWMLLSGDREAMSAQLADVLEGYEQFRPFDRRELALIEPLRTLRMIHHAAWIGRRWADPAFPAAFTWFGTERYWQDQILGLREQVALMEEEPLAPAPYRA